MHPVSLNNSFQAELTNRLKSVGSNAASIFSGSLRDAGIKVGPVFLLHLGSSVQIELWGRGRSMWTTLFTVVLILAATLNVLAIVSNYTPPEF